MKTSTINSRSAQASENDAPRRKPPRQPAPRQQLDAPKPSSLQSPVPDALPPLPSEPDASRLLSSAEATSLALSPPQRLAIEHLTAGYSLIATATAAGVTRMTLYRWLNRDARFQAAYNAWQLDALTCARTRLLAAADDAVTTIVSAVRTDPRVALSVLKSVGALDRATPGSTDPEEVEERMRIARQKSDTKLGEQAFFASLGAIGLDEFGLSGAGLASGGKKTSPANHLR